MKCYILLISLVSYVTAGTISGRIMGGLPAEKGQFPYVAAIKDQREVIGMGTIISENWVLTTMINIRSSADPDKLTVLVGTNTLNDGGLEVTVNKVVKMPLFNVLTHENDIALLRLSQFLEFNDFVKPIRLHSENIEEVDQEVTVAGFGSLSIPGGPSNTLQYLKGNLLDLTQCRMKFIFDFVDIYDSMICMNGVSGHGGCMYDAGSPLVMDGKLLGILSFGKPCGTGKPDVYQRIPYFAYYITEIAGTA